MTLKSGESEKQYSEDCLSCRVWGGTAHIAAAVYVASHWRKQNHLASKAFLGIFSAGKI